MNTHNPFHDFDKAVRLSKAKIEQLKGNRSALRSQIKNYFELNDWELPKFYSQGSFPLNTNLNPIAGGEYDLDDGVYIICPKSEKKDPATYHDRLMKAVGNHATSAKDKNTCIRVIYADGHHIDLPCYWMETERDTPQLAHKSAGFIHSDPKEFKQWVEQNIDYSNSNDQLRRVIRYLKAWQDYRESVNGDLRLACGFVWTILACENFRKAERDDLSFKLTVEAIQESLSNSFVCRRPTTPKGENVLAKYNEKTILDELKKLIEYANKAIDSKYEEDAANCWRKIFGDRFPRSKGSGMKKTSSTITIPTVAATKPYYARSFTDIKDGNSMRVTDDDMMEIRKHFPNMTYHPDRHCVCGTISFCSKYKKTKSGQLTVTQASHDDRDSFEGEYHIKIALRERGNPIVYETGDKIRNVANRQGQDLIELHFFTNDSCCLDYMTSTQALSISFYQFVVHKVYPYFAWQAFREKFGKLPPCGEYSHDPVRAKQEFNKDKRNTGRNDLCFCGSGKKRKKCHEHDM